MKILAVCGSLKAQSANLALLRTAAQLAPPGVAVHLYDGLGELPHFNPDTEEQGLSPSVAQWRKALATSDAVLIAAPEYGHSLPGVLKNAIDWVIGSGELEGKLVALTASTPAPDRGRLGLGALRDTLRALSARIVGGDPITRGPEMTVAVGRLLDALIEQGRASGLEGNQPP
jgi:chromate reductase, NAD(P)H dehydrogenase (quinone)